MKTETTRTQHTPGPWTAKPHGNHCFLMSENAQGFYCVCDVDTATEQGRANARLIAAAPDLLEALTELVTRRERASAKVGGSPDGSDNRYARARAAIAKAEGRSA